MRLFLCTLLSIVCLSPALWAQTPPPSIRVTGNAEVSAEPDQARFTVGARVNAPTAEAAMSRVGEITDRIIRVLTERGVPRTAIQTVQLNLNQFHEGGPREEQPRQPSYEAVHILAVEVGRERFEQLGELLGAATQAGANTVGEVVFGLTDDEALERKGLALAVEDARAKAEAIARAAGVTLGGVYSVAESGWAGPPMPMERVQMSVQAPSPVPPSQIRRNYSVVVEYRI